MGFCRTEGIKVGSFRRYWASACKRAGLVDGDGFHDLECLSRWQKEYQDTKPDQCLSRTISLMNGTFEIQKKGSGLSLQKGGKSNSRLRNGCDRWRDSKFGCR